MKRMAKVLAYVLSASMVMQTPVNVVQAAEADDISSTTIVADLKIADTGALEVEMAAKAGANIVCILASCDDAVITDALRPSKV